jgi:hypothetical protein
MQSWTSSARRCDQEDPMIETGTIDQEATGVNCIRKFKRDVEHEIAPAKTHAARLFIHFFER